MEKEGVMVQNFSRYDEEEQIEFEHVLSLEAAEKLGSTCEELDMVSRNLYSTVHDSSEDHDDIAAAKYHLMRVQTRILKKHNIM